MRKLIRFFMAIVGEKEINHDTIAIRANREVNMCTDTIQAFLEFVLTEMK